MRFRGFLLLALVTACASTDSAIPYVEQAGIRVERTPAGERLVREKKALTPDFPAIDSFSVSAERGEVVFSAKRKDSFDIGLVSTDGSPIHWVPEDPADEVAVQWAPRGNKISFVVRGRTGDLVRTVHVPTSAALTVDFPYATVRSLTWEPAAERFAVTPRAERP